MVEELPLRLLGRLDRGEDVGRLAPEALRVGEQLLLATARVDAVQADRVAALGARLDDRVRGLAELDLLLPGAVIQVLDPDHDRDDVGRRLDLVLGDGRRGVEGEEGNGEGGDDGDGLQGGFSVAGLGGCSRIFKVPLAGVAPALYLITLAGVRYSRNFLSGNGKLPL